MSDAVKQEIVRGPDGRAIPDPDNKGRPLREAKMSVKAMMGLVFLALRRQHPEVTFDDVRAMKMSEVDFDIEEEVDPTGLPATVEEPKSSEVASESSSPV